MTTPEGVEIQLGYYAFEARWYDPAIGRFTGVDPIADAFAHLSVYNYADNSPISNIDLWGLQAYSAIDGSFVTQNGDDKTKRVVTASAEECSSMSCEELLENSVQVQESTNLNKGNSLGKWGTENQNKGTEHAMALYEGTVTNEDGSESTVFAESETITDENSSTVNMSDIESPIEGWTQTDVIHNHPNGNIEPSDFNSSLFGGDIDYAKKNNVNMHIVTPNNAKGTTFDVSKYNMQYERWRHEKAKGQSMKYNNFFVPPKKK